VPPSASKYNMPAAVAYKEELREKAEVRTGPDNFFFLLTKPSLGLLRVPHQRRKELRARRSPSPNSLPS
jgi:hypothetical protein